MKPPLNLTEAAKYLKVSRSWLYQNKETLPHHRLPGTQQIRFFEEELEDWLINGGTEQNLTEVETASVANSQPAGYYRKSRTTR